MRPLALVTSSKLDGTLEGISHPEDAEAGLGDGGVERGRDAERQDHARVQRIDDAVVPEAGGAVIRAALRLVLLPDRRGE